MLTKHCLQEFKLDCQLRRLTDRTIKGYYNNTLNFLAYSEKHHGITEVEEIHALHIKHYMLTFAEYERGMIVERTQTGKAVARQDPSFYEGRPRKFTSCQLELLDSCKSCKQAEAMTGISKSTLTRVRRCA